MRTSGLILSSSKHDGDQRARADMTRPAGGAMAGAGRLRNVLTYFAAALLATLAIVPVVGATPTPLAPLASTYDTVAYVYDAPALLSSQSATTKYVRGSPSGPEVASWVSPVSVVRGVVAANTAEHAVPIGPASADAWTVLNRVDAKGSPLPGYKGGSIFRNEDGLLPETPGVTYREWDVHPNVPGSRETLSGSSRGAMVPPIGRPITTTRSPCSGG